jgi:hypothetical protein
LCRAQWSSGPNGNRHDRYSQRGHENENCRFSSASIPQGRRENSRFHHALPLEFIFAHSTTVFWIAKGELLVGTKFYHLSDGLMGRVFACNPNVGANLWRY